MLVRVTLGKKLDRALRRGHPWVFRAALSDAPHLPDGTLVAVASRAGRSLGVGFWDADSAIAVRMLATEPLGDPRAAVRRRLAAALRLRLERLDRSRTTAFRWVHGEADRLPGIHVDLYGEVVVVRFDGQGARAFYDGVAAELAELARPLALTAVVDRDGGRLLWGAPPPPDLVVQENGLWFEVAAGTAGKGGLFLDQRENRAEVERRSAGRRMLNLFGYTGGFSLYAARGGARATDTVEVARPAIAAARRNFRRNGLGLDRARFHPRDVFEFLAHALARGERWDLVVSDPPSFAASQRAAPRARQAYTRLHRLAAAVTAPGGILCAASCSSHLRREEFLATLTEGARRAGRRPVVEAVRGAGFDHPVTPAFPEGDYLKFAIARVP